MPEVRNLTTVDEIADLIAEFRADNTVPVFCPEEGDETWIYATHEAGPLSPLKAVLPTPVFKAWQTRAGIRPAPDADAGAPTR